MRGNHDDMAVYWSNFPPEARPKKVKWLQSMTQDEIDFLANLPLTIMIPEANVIIVHAGILPGVSLDSQHPQIVTTLRNLHCDDIVCY